MGDFSILANRIKELRASMNKTQREFSELVGCTAATLSAYENGSKSPSLEIVKNIAEKCEVSIDWLCGLTDKRNYNEQLHSYADVMKLIIQAEKGCSFTITGHDNEVKFVKISDSIMQTFLADWQGMLDLYHKHTIDKKLYDLWVSDKLKEYNWIHLGNEEDIIEYLQLRDEIMQNEL